MFKAQRCRSGLRLSEVLFIGLGYWADGNSQTGENLAVDLALALLQRPVSHLRGLLDHPTGATRFR
jgi:hypothetical protein